MSGHSWIKTINQEIYLRCIKPIFYPLLGVSKISWKAGICSSRWKARLKTCNTVGVNATILLTFARDFHYRVLGEFPYHTIGKGPPAHSTAHSRCWLYKKRNEERSEFEFLSFGVGADMWGHLLFMLTASLFSIPISRE